MTIAGFFLLIFLVSMAGWIVLSVKPQKLAYGLKMVLPVLLIGSGGALTWFNRGSVGIPLIGLGLMMFSRMRSVTKMSGSSRGTKSNVRSAALEMELEHDTGEMDGVVLVGLFEGQRLGNLSEEDLFDLLNELQSDEESVLLLEAYLDRRVAGWREDANGNTGAGQAAAPRSGAMSKQEAYQILGLDPGVGAAEIRKAHRRLMKGMHPDSGGSTFLAAKINEAKEVLLNGHT